MRHLLALVLMLLCTCTHAQSNFVLDAKPGSYAVGLRVLQQHDATRAYKRKGATPGAAAVLSERGRPLLALVWYPTRDMGAKLTSTDYLRITRADEQFDLPADEVERKAEAWVKARSAKMPKDVVLKELQQATMAQRDATPAPGTFPLIVYAPGFGSSAAENAELCEFLASQGYVVIASASIGARERAMGLDSEGVEAQAADIRFLIGTAQQLPQADLGHVGVVGFSWGGMADLIAAAQDSRIRAVVSLDGPFRYVHAFVDGSAKAARDVSAGRITTPLLFVGSRDKSIEALNMEKIDTSRSFINEMTHADVYLATMRPLRHFDFASQLLRFTPADVKDEYSRQEVLAAYGWTARYTQAFLDAYLKGSAAGRSFLDRQPTENGVPLHMMSLERRMANSGTAK